MTRTAIAACAAVALGAAPAAGQTTTPRFYVGGSTAADIGSRGPIPGGAVPSAGALFGVRITEAWSLEVEVEHGFRTTGRTSESLWISFAPRDSTREEIERLGVRARFDRTQKAGPGWSALAMWRSRDPARLNAGLFFGVSSRAYDSRVVRTPTSIPTDPGISPTHPGLQPSDTTRTMVGGGLTGGFTILAQVTPALTLAPEFRYTHGLMTDGPYRVFRTGVRVMWSF